jgi:membrane associated rhomboid family serine protease
MALEDRDYMKGTGKHRWSDIMWPDATTTIVIVNVAVFLLQQLNIVGSEQVFDPNEGQFVTTPLGALSISALLQGKVWTILTHLFVHGSVMHLVGNCFMIFFTGKAVQSLIGSRHFLHIYFLSGLVGAATELMAGWLMHKEVAIIGASGAAFGTLLALAVMLPQEMITAMLYFIIPVRLRLWTLAMVLVGISAICAVLQTTGIWDLGIANFDHLGGALAGWWFVRLLGYGGPPVTYEHMWEERQRREEKRAYAGVRKRQRTMESDEAEVVMPPLTKKQLIEQEIDPILDKIAAHGIESLSQEERRLLARASDQVRKQV